MSIEEIKEKLRYALLNEGIYVDDDDMLISEYVLDSLSFISLIVQIESQFDIELPEEILNWERLGTINSLSLYLKSLLSNDPEPHDIQEETAE